MKSLSELSRNWRQAKDAYKQLQVNSPRIAGDIAVKVFQLNIREKHGFDTGNGIETWEKRKPQTDAAYDRSRQGKGKNRNYKGSRYNSGNPLLFQTHELFNSITHAEEGNTTYVGVNTNQTSEGKVRGLNEGTGNMVPRKFIGYSKYLVDMINMNFRSRRAQVFNKFKM
jgi:phage gpG-like protein